MVSKFASSAYHCRKCGNNWKELGKNAPQEGIYEPECPSCKSADVVPAELPAMPIGIHYTQPKMEQSRQPRLNVHVWVPRCGKCKRIHTNVRWISWVIAIMSSCLVPFGLLALSNPSNLGNLDLWGFIWICVFAFFIVGLPTLCLSRLVLRRIISRRSAPEKIAKTYPAVKELKQLGWTFVYMAPNADIIRSSLTSTGESRPAAAEAPLHQVKTKHIPFEILLNEAAGLPLRRDWPMKAKLFAINIGIAFGSLLGIPFGFAIAMLEPPKTLLPISLFGFVLIVAAPISFVYFCVKAFYYFSRPCDAKTLFEYLRPFLSISHPLLGEEYSSKKKNQKIPTQFVLPSSRDKFHVFLKYASEKCLQEAKQRGWPFVYGKKMRIATSHQSNQATCLFELVASDGRTKEPLGTMILKAVKSSALNWYFVVPDLAEIESWLKFAPTNQTD